MTTEGTVLWMTTEVIVLWMTTEVVAMWMTTEVAGHSTVDMDRRRSAVVDDRCDGA